jgi:threonine/homoserine/homoserine lactone efflux protein
MDLLWFYLVQSIGLGLGVAIAPGPLQAYLLAQTVRHGPRHTLPLVLAPVVSDVPIIALVLFTLAWLPEIALRGLQVAGGLLLLYFARETYQALKTHHAAPPPRARETGQSFLKAVLMNALSPGPYIFWSTIAGPLFLRAWAESHALGYMFLAGFGAALVAGLSAYVLVSGSSRHVDDKYRPLISTATVILLLGFGAYQVWAGLFAPAAVALAH